MIGFNNLATMGRFGNQMFQYAAIKGIAKNIGVEYTIPPVVGREIQHHNYGLFEAFKLSTNKNVGWLSTRDTLQEKQFHFDEEFFNSCQDEKNILGFFQTEKYFQNVSGHIRNVLRSIHHNLLNIMKRHLKSLILMFL